MSGLEQAIRNALDRAERERPEIRARIYQSARNALDAGLRKQEVEDADVIDRQRQRLEMTISAIEDEELDRLRALARLEKVLIEKAPEPEAIPVTDAVPPRNDPVSSPPPVGDMDMSAVHPGAEDRDGHDASGPGDDSLAGLSAMRDEPAVRAGKPGRLAPEIGEARPPRRKAKRARHEEEDPAWADPTTPEGMAISPKRRERRRRSGSFLISLFVYSVLIGTIPAAVWWVQATGMLSAAINGSGDFDLVPKELQGENYDPNANVERLDPLRGFSGEWLDIFMPANVNAVAAGPSARYAPVSDSDGAAISITSTAPDQDGEVRIEVPAAILQDLAGKTSTIAVTLRADGDLPSQIYVQCEFRSLGDCGRHRFTVSNERVDKLIQVRYDGTLGPTEAGHIVINSDLTGEGRAIRLYGIRVLPGS